MSTLHCDHRIYLPCDGVTVHADAMITCVLIYESTIEFILINYVLQPISCNFTYMQWYGLCSLFIVYMSIFSCRCDPNQL